MLQSSRQRLALAFTLVELMVAVAILLILIGAVGVVFRSASNAVGASQSTMDLLSNVDAIQRQLTQDVQGMDKSQFLVIRCGLYKDNAGLSRRCDLISFISRGNFPHRTGASQSASPFTDYDPVAPNAFITWGQLAMESSGASTSLNPLTATQDLPPNQNFKVALNQVPTGLLTASGTFNEASVILGRNVVLLLPKNQDDPSTDVLTRVDASSGTQTTVSAYQNNPGATIAAIDYNAAAVSTNSETAADITESRTDVAATTTAQLQAYLVQGLANAGGRAGAPRFEANDYCYRHAALRSVYDTEILRSGATSLPNGYFRMSPIALQGVSSFAVDWTDGSVFTGTAGEVDVTNGQAVAAGSELIGTTKWFGIYNDATGMSNRNVTNPYQSTMVDYGDSPASAPVVTTAAKSNGDSYTAIFSYDNAASWPVALRFRYHVADPSGRLPGGRDVVSIVKLP